MRTSLAVPDRSSLAHYHARLATYPFNYAEQGASRHPFPAGYDHDRNRILLGSGSTIFAQAKALLQDWQHFPDQWTKIYNPTPHIAAGQEVVVLFQIFGLWWRNGARIVYVRDEPAPEELAYYGFAYGTLQGHIERGEEIFYVCMDTDENVYYGIQAFSTPAWWPVKMVYPLARYFQRRFVQDSMEQMKEKISL